ncbi:MAG: hypothetical protein ACYDEY_02325 [Acidimicrobiales bacterium]
MDDDYITAEVVDRFLFDLRFGRDRAETTTRVYAGELARLLTSGTARVGAAWSTVLGPGHGRRSGGFALLHEPSQPRARVPAPHRGRRESPRPNPDQDRRPPRDLADRNTTLLRSQTTVVNATHRRAHRTHLFPTWRLAVEPAKYRQNQAFPEALSPSNPSDLLKSVDFPLE